MANTRLASDVACHWKHRTRLMKADQLLPEFVGIFVPLEIMRLEQVGGPKEADWPQRLPTGTIG